MGNVLHKLNSISNLVIDLYRNLMIQFFHNNWVKVAGVINFIMTPMTPA
jgi:hypothetical protein